MLGQLWELMANLGQALAVFGKHLFVEFTGASVGAGWAEIFVDAFAAPRCLDEQHRFVVSLADEVAELEFRPYVVISAIAGEADRQSTGLYFFLGLDRKSVV